MEEVEKKSIEKVEDAENVKQHCFGCGAELQSDSPNEKGYIPLEAYHRQRPLLCQRCYRIQHYNEDKNEEQFDKEQFIKILRSAKASNSLIVYVIDLFSFESTFIRDINMELEGMDVLLVANKRDILPKSVDDEKLKDYVMRNATDQRLNVVDIIITSANRNYNIDELIQRVMSFRHDGNVFVIGAASAGKSSIINTLLRNYSNETMHFITTSPYPGTTLDVIEVPIDDKSCIYDTPGLNISNSMLTIVDKKVINLITPKSEVKPRTFQLNSKQSLLIGGLAYLDFEQGWRANFTVYASNMVMVTRSKMDRAPSVFNNLVRQNQIKPTTSSILRSDDLEEHQFILANDGKKYDIGINGYCWISVEAKGQKICMHSPKGISVYLVQSKI